MARREKVVWASLPQFSYVSTARGIHSQPSSEHLGSFVLCFLASASSAAAPSALNSEYKNYNNYYAVIRGNISWQKRTLYKTN